MQKKYLNQTLLIIAKMAIVLFGFFFWFIIISLLGYIIAGIIIGSLCATILLIVMNAKRSIEQCDNVNTPHAGTYADEQLEKQRRLTHLSGHQLKRGRARSNHFRQSGQSKTGNI